MRTFADDIDIHDGLFRSVILDPRRRRLTMKLRCGDLQVGHYNLDMTFDGIALAPDMRKRLRLLVNRKKTEVLYDEIDVTDEKGTYEYRFICWPDGEVDLRFQGFAYKKTAIRGREFVASWPRFRVRK